MRDDILKGMATIFWGLNWANHADEHRCYDLSGCQIEQHMPPIPDMVHEFCKEVAREIETASGATLDELFTRAREADPTVDDDDDAERFGECLAYAYRGDGVSWEDDHKKVPGLVVPYGEDYEIRDHADSTCDAEKDASAYDLARIRPQVAYCGCYVATTRLKCEGHGYPLLWRGREPLYVPEDLRAFYRKVNKGSLWRGKMDLGSHWRGAKKRAKAARRLARLCRKAAH